MDRKIRGVCVCQNEDCGLPQNQDRTSAANIVVQFGRLMRGEGPIRPGAHAPGVADTTPHFTDP